MSVNASFSTRNDLYKETLQNMRKGSRVSTNDCPLNKPNIGLISENDHLTRRCLCPICTCGKHICPSSAILDPYPASTFNSQYMANFSLKSPDRAKIPKNIGNFFPAVSFDFETTNGDYYKPNIVAHNSQNHRYIPNSPPKTPFNAKSSYSNNFLNWGGGINSIVKKKHDLHTSPGVKLNGKTSYHDNFCSLDPEDIKLARPDTVKKEHNTHIDPAAVFNKNTTNRAQFIDYSKNYHKETELRPNNIMPRMKSVDNHYATTNRNDFRKYEGEIDHRILRKVIEKEGLGN